MRSASLAARASLALVAALFLCPAFATAQVLVPQPGFGTLNVNYQWAHAKYHLSSNIREDLGPMDSQTMFVGGDYCFVRGLAASASAAFVAARYMGDEPEHATDTKEFQSSPQDATIGLHYVAGFQGITIAGSSVYTFPMSDYLTMGHNALGRGINQFTIGLSLSRALPKIPGAVAAVGISHDWEENVSIWGLDSNAFTAGLGYYVTSSLAVGAHFSYSATIDGFDWADPADWATP